LVQGAPVKGNRIVLADRVLAREWGLDLSSLRGDGFFICCDGKDTVLIVGNDARLKDAGRVGVNQATLNGVYRFLEKTAGAYWIWPGNDGWLLPKAATITLPAMRVKDEPFMLLRLLPRTPSYNMAANGATVRGEGGHSWYFLVPATKYYATHPEFFAKDAKGKVLPIRVDRFDPEGVRKGLYSSEQRLHALNSNSLCVSTPGVAQAMIQEIGALYDQGYDIVDLAQNDSWGRQCPACQCPPCREMDGGPNDGHPNARRLWTFHLGIARELHKKYPGKYVRVSAYSPCGSGYLFLKKDDFTPNVIVEVPGSGEENWQGIAPHVTNYCYLWGNYDLLGQTPRTTPYDIAKHIQRLAQANAVGIYWCGGCHNWGLAGDQYFLAARLMWNPKEDVERILDTYYSYFGEAKGQAREFGRAFAQVLDQARDRPDKAKAGPLTKRNNIAAYAWFFPANARDLLDQRLKAAEAAATDPLTKRKLQVVRDGLDFTLSTAAACERYLHYQRELSPDAFLLMKQSVDARRQQIDEVFSRYGYDPAKHKDGMSYVVNGLPFPFGSKGATPEDVAADGRGAGGMGALGYPFNGALDKEWDMVKTTQGQGIRGLAPRAQSAPVIDARPDDACWQSAEWSPLRVNNGFEPAVPAALTAFCADDNNLYVIARMDEPNLAAYKPPKNTARDSSVWDDDCVEIYLSPAPDGNRYLHLILGLSGAVWDSRLGFTKDDFDPATAKEDPTFNAEFTHAVRQDLQSKQWWLEAAIPFKNVGLTPQALPSLLRVNLCRERHHAEQIELSAWSPTFGKFSRPASFGRLYLFERADSPRLLLKNAAFETATPGQDVPGWKKHIHPGALATIVPLPAPDKGSALRLETTRPDGAYIPMLTSATFDVQPGVPVRCCIRIRELQRGAVFGASVSFSPRPDETPESVKQCKISLVPPARGPHDDWVTIEKTVVPPATVRKGQVSLWVSCSGVASQANAALVHDVRVEQAHIPQ